MVARHRHGKWKFVDGLWRNSQNCLTRVFATYPNFVDEGEGRMHAFWELFNFPKPNAYLGTVAGKVVRLAADKRRCRIGVNTHDVYITTTIIGLGPGERMILAGGCCSDDRSPN